ncbi:MAG: CsbD family protein [Anaerolineae bacterium]
MNSSVLEGQWKQLRGKIKETWGELTDDDLDRASGKYDQMVGVLQERYGYSKADAEREFSSFLDDLKEAV